MRVATTPKRVLYLDTECRPGHWIGGDYVSKVLTAGAWWAEGMSHVAFMTHYDNDPRQIADQLFVAIDEADIVVGHYIRGFDLRLINGERLRNGDPSLGNVLAHDTKLDLKTTGGRSLSQKNLASQLGVTAEKVDVTLPEWEGFNARMPGFETKIIRRVTDDVRQNIELREALLKRGWLGPPTVWRPGAAKSGSYHA